MVSEEKIRITEVKEIGGITYEWYNLESRIKNKIQTYKGKVITIWFLDKLLDSEGEVKKTWYDVTHSHPRHYISHRTLPVTETRKKILKERDMKIGITGYVIDGKPIPIEEFEGYTNSNLILYFKKVENRNEFRIGIFDINWVLVGEDLKPQIELITRDLIGIKYEEV